MIMEYLQSVMQEAGPRIAIRLQNELKIEAPVKDGRLRSSITVLYDNQTLRIFGVDYILHVEFGTKPHMIRPKSKKALAFKAGGTNVVVKNIMHPGTRPNPFVRDTIFRQLKKIIIEELNR